MGDYFKVKLFGILTVAFKSALDDGKGNLNVKILADVYPILTITIPIWNCH